MSGRATAGGVAIALIAAVIILFVVFSPRPASSSTTPNSADFTVSCSGTGSPSGTNYPGGHIQPYPNGSTVMFSWTSSNATVGYVWIEAVIGTWSYYSNYATLFWSGLPVYETTYALAGGSGAGTFSQGIQLPSTSSFFAGSYSFGCSGAGQVAFSTTW